MFNNICKQRKKLVIGISRLKALDVSGALFRFKTYGSGFRTKKKERAFYGLSLYL